jgi:CDP-diacylglycerol--glycerol-3-phosphate 3-phosphatidyltransferase
MNLESLFLILLNSFILLNCAFFGIFIFPKRPLSDETIRRPRSFISNAFFREFWYFLMGPLKRRFIAWDISPNTLTWWGFIFSAAAGVYFSQSNFGVGGWFVVLAATCDVYDGMLARAKNISLKSGAFLDSMLDRAGESFFFFGLAWAFRDDAFWFAVLFITFTASQIVSYARARAEGLGFGGTRGFFQRAERLIVLAAGMGLVNYLVAFNQPYMWLVYATLSILCLGSVQTALARSIEIFKDIRKTEI